jgi:hypothetical protein
VGMVLGKCPLIFEHRYSCVSDEARFIQETSHSPAECTTLLRWSPRKGTEGSNPSVSAFISSSADHSPE